jgi:hypothetical protein
VFACTPGCQKLFHCEIDPPAPASSSNRLVTGEFHVACMNRFGSKRYPVWASCITAAEVDPQLHAFWLSMKKLILCFGVACHVSRPSVESYHSQRPLILSSGRSIQGVNRTTSRWAPGGVRS